MKIDKSQLITPEFLLAQAQEQALAARRSAYVTESDPLKIAAEFDAIKNSTEPDYSEWIAAVESIKQRIPLVNAGTETTE